MAIDEAFFAVESSATLTEVLNQVNSKNADRMESRKRPRAMNGDKKYLREAGEHL